MRKKRKKEKKFDVEDHPRPFLSIQTPTPSRKRKKFYKKKLSFENAQLKGTLRVSSMKI
jgi:hypothetical protein